jgi:hypothetical protein
MDTKICVLKRMSALYSVIVFWIVLLGLLAYEASASQKSGFVGYVTDLTPEVKDLSVGPAKSDLDPKQPYHLLNGWLESSKGRVGCLTSACCPETDFEQRSNLVGNYINRTNNYKRADPDNCSTPLKELTLSFYKQQVL